MKISIYKEFYKKLNRENKLKAIHLLEEKTGTTKLCIRNNWFSADRFPKEHQKLVEKILKKVLNEQEAENSRKETV